MADLITRLRKRAESYRLSGPSAEHTAALLDDAADALEGRTDLLAALHDIEAKAALAASIVESDGVRSGFELIAERARAAVAGAGNRS